MSKIELDHSKGAVNRAGVTLLSPEQQGQHEAKSVLDNWRGCHVAPLNSFQTSLRLRLKKVDGKALVSQRLKRTPSILSKLERNPGMKLARMQDIGGIRAVVKTMREVREIESAYKKGTRVFSLVKGGKDYINYPKDSGYRSVHMIFKCKDGFSIELQVRTEIQHAWATAVETMGTFLDHSLKSSQGPEEWLSFFTLASSAFAILESTPRAPEHDSYSARQVLEALLEKEQELDVIKKLSGFRVAARHIEADKEKGHYHLVTLNLETRFANIQTYAPKDIDRANIEYSLKEERVKKGENLQVVLVTSESISALKKAYPSFFLDAQLFATQIAVVRRKLAKMA
ncbi:(p)ppGpp synthetase [Halieaceae bacterium IMCC14734]|uniref:(P)ppGpp synthetase n=1 Tax=Candidatus Litorirhabdus singularis TaxID=2518993 RepID=A0ABT3TKN0_9GAMM|nr:RelA/SpoT domain-containing protein [Candidatus Litorirhabdus singularis]MCX2982882.1 (p)ppGpp synthetase [Candidatus Litorirhabdus singularis]